MMINAFVLTLQLKFAVFAQLAYPPWLITSEAAMTSRAYELELSYTTPNINWPKVVEAGKRPAGSPPVGYPRELRDDLTAKETAIYMNGLCCLKELVRIIPEYARTLLICESITSIDDVYSLSHWSFNEPVGGGGPPYHVYLLHNGTNVVPPTAAIRKVTIVGIADDDDQLSAKGIYSLSIPIDERLAADPGMRVIDNASAERRAAAAIRTPEVLAELLEIETAQAVFFVARGAPSWIVWFRFKQDVEAISVDGSRPAWHPSRLTGGDFLIESGDEQFPVYVRSNGSVNVGELYDEFELSPVLKVKRGVPVESLSGNLKRP